MLGISKNRSVLLCLEEKMMCNLFIQIYNEKTPRNPQQIKAAVKSDLSCTVAESLTVSCQQ
jgi:hypothetical protein